jgi:hypothetical protein
MIDDEGAVPSLRHRPAAPVCMLDGLINTLSVSTTPDGAQLQHSILQQSLASICSPLACLAGHWAPAAAACYHRCCSPPPPTAWATPRSPARRLLAGWLDVLARGRVSKPLDYHVTQQASIDSLSTLFGWGEDGLAPRPAGLTGHSGLVYTTIQTALRTLTRSSRYPRAPHILTMPYIWRIF